ncbi:TRAP transporter substrate-binding protein [Pelagibacterium sediminicola]|uniref:TRAP transporter substrate-binding protein n=1 Tax=Pelagibacterium sediminicola TaxID=2248761 RepID=UPI000E313BD2|nr:TRAP transporter substrate-binding protein [Pelagibacterium sediminicola]
MKITSLTGGALALLLATTSLGFAAEFDLKLGHAAIGEDNPLNRAVEFFAEGVEAASDGRISVEIFGGGQMGDDRELVELAQEGTIDIAVPTVSKLSAWDPAFSAPEIPYMFPDRKVALAVLKGDFGAFLEPRLNDLGLTTVGWFENGFREMTNNVRPITRPEDLSGIKLRTMAVEAHIEAFDHLGANPTPMAFSELYSALQQNVVDGQENPLTNIVNNKMYEVQRYVSMTNHVYSAYIAVMNQGRFEAMPADLQDILKASLDKALDHELSLIDEAEARNLEIIREAGVEVNTLSDEELAAFRDKIGELSGEFEKLVGADAYAELAKAVANAEKAQ